MSDDTDDLRKALAAIDARIAALPIQQVGNFTKQALEILVASHTRLEQRLATVETTLHGHIQSLQQTVGMLARTRPLHGRRPIKVFFFIHMPEAWEVVADIYAAMRAAPDFDAMVATIPRLDPETEEYRFEDQTHEAMSRMGIPHLRFGMQNSFEALDIIKAMAPDLIFRQTPWENAVPHGFTAGEISFARICYVPYGYIMVKRLSAEEDPAQGQSPLHTDQPFHRTCWRIFCETEMHHAMYKRASSRGDGNIAVTGSPKFDRLIAAQDRAPHWPVKTESGKKRRCRVIWAPHDSVKSEWLGFGVFCEIQREMVAWAKAAEQDYEFVLKPHPQLFDKLIATRAMTPEEVAAFIRMWQSLPNAAIFDGPDYGPLFLASDAMLTDGISFLAEYQLFRKPLVWFDSGRHSGFNEAGAVAMQAAHAVRTVQEAAQILDRLRSGEADPLAAVREEVLARIAPYPGQNAQRVLNAIREGLAREDSITDAEASGILKRKN